MEKDLLQGPIGEAGMYDVEFKGGKLIAKANAAADFGTASILVSIDASKVIDAIAAAVPGKIDDVVLGVVKTALLS